MLGFFLLDWLRGSRNIPLEHVEEEQELLGSGTAPRAEVKAEIASGPKPESIQTSWFLYVLDPLLGPPRCNSSLECLLVHRLVALGADRVAVKLVKDGSCAPSGRLPILVDQQDGQVVEAIDLILCALFKDIQNDPALAPTLAVLKKMHNLEGNVSFSNRIHALFKGSNTLSARIRQSFCQSRSPAELIDSSEIKAELDAIKKGDQSVLSKALTDAVTQHLELWPATRVVS